MRYSGGYFRGYIAFLKRIAQLKKELEEYQN
jgi:hypothetical protein